ncbi:MAG: LysM peptidoglycan-binding domain-containing protein [Saprospiraceae bacterium]|nr:LysM peptidoglycan-binding domain-containing protein [Saprospiraceae bacterium]
MKFNLSSNSCKSIIATTFLLLFTSSNYAQVIEIQRISSNESDLYFMHKIRKSETLFSIARTYGVNLPELTNYNSDIATKLITESHEIRIPIEAHSILEDSIPGASPVYYKIKPKDNLFSLSHRVFKKSENLLAKLNSGNTSNMHPGNFLKIGYFKFNVPAESVLAKEVHPQENSERIEESPIHLIPNAAYSRGIAYVERNRLGEGRYFALHATAPIESSIAITNPVNMRTIYAKVIGRLPPIYEAGTQVVVSSSVARYLGIPDNRFYAVITYQQRK